jgi:hypothetical protein
MRVARSLAVFAVLAVSACVSFQDRFLPRATVGEDAFVVGTFTKERPFGWNLWSVGVKIVDVDTGESFSIKCEVREEVYRVYQVPPGTYRVAAIVYRGGLISQGSAPLERFGGGLVGLLTGTADALRDAYPALFEPFTVGSSEAVYLGNFLVDHKSVGRESVTTLSYTYDVDYVRELQNASILDSDVRLRGLND